MIKVNITNDKIDIIGHADYDEYGKDIVCAAVSSIVTTSINACLSIDEESVIYEEDNGKVSIKIMKDDNITNKLIDNMINLLEELEKEYSNNIKIIRR